MAAPGCEDGVGELADYSLLYDMEVPTTAAPWLDGVDYAVDNSATIDTPISRVAYCLEGQQGLTPTWSYASMDAWTQDLDALAVPEADAASVRRPVTGLTVRSSIVQSRAVAPPANGASGYLELWSSRYLPAVAAGGAAGGDNASYDYSDTRLPTTTTTGYGSFQVHNVTNRTTVLAVNGWASQAATPLDLGFGSRATSHPDWTFAKNRAEYRDVRLKVFVKPGGVSILAAPANHQLYPRDSGSDRVAVPVTGRTTDAGIAGTRLIVRRDGVTVEDIRSTGPAFDFRPSITAEFAQYDFELRAIRTDGRDVLVRSAVDVVAGDTYVINGQSNSVATVWSYAPEFSSGDDSSPWVRTFGSTTADPTLSVADRVWYRGIGQSMGIPDWQTPGLIGRLGARIGQVMSEKAGVPVAVILGGHPGERSTFFQRSDANPSDARTNYGRLKQRLEAGGLVHSVRSIIWYQGESDVPLGAAAHQANVVTLLEDWAVDYPSLEQTYLVQVRAGCGGDTSDIQEVQRRLDARADVTLIGTNGLDNHDGCHFGYERGYRQLADWIVRPLSRDRLGMAPAGPIAAPQAATATWGDAGRTTIRISLTDPGLALTCRAGAARDFRLSGTQATVADISCGTGTLTLTLTASVPPTTTLSYVGHAGSVGPASADIADGDWISNSLGMGLISFDAVAIT
ncbi:sialate O-acetylesterase [Labedella populi]|uniref:sialate O-acetylesterase n=1 Tax=Labedella populi TaxID=2498850 RepID=UPI00140B8F0D|nr:sialate O-acetylesterase [Labedella populi]